MGDMVNLCTDAVGHLRVATSSMYVGWGVCIHDTSAHHVHADVCPSKALTPRVVAALLAHSSSFPTRTIAALVVDGASW